MEDPFDEPDGGEEDEDDENANDDMIEPTCRISRFDMEGFDERGHLEEGVLVRCPIPMCRSRKAGVHILAARVEILCPACSTRTTLLCPTAEGSKLALLPTSDWDHTQWWSIKRGEMMNPPMIVTSAFAGKGLCEEDEALRSLGLSVERLLLSGQGSLGPANHRSRGKKGDVAVRASADASGTGVSNGCGEGEVIFSNNPSNLREAQGRDRCAFEASAHARAAFSPDEPGDEASRTEEAKARCQRPPASPPVGDARAEFPPPGPAKKKRRHRKKGGPTDGARKAAGGGIDAEAAIEERGDEC